MTGARAVIRVLAAAAVGVAAGTGAAPAFAAPECTASGPALSMRAGETRLLSLSCPDPGGGFPSPEIVTPFQHATIEAAWVSPPATRAFRVTTPAGYTGTDTLTYRASTSSGPSAEFTVTITIRPSTDNAPPTCQVTGGWRPLVMARGSVLDLRCADPDGDPYLVDAGTAPSGGTFGASLMAADPGPDAARWVSYTPHEGFSGTDRFTVRAMDDRGASTETAVEITTDAAPGPPVTAASAPVVKLGATPRLASALSRGIRVRVRSSTSGRARARLVLGASQAKRLKLSRRGAVIVASGAAGVASGRESAITLRFTRAARRALRRERMVVLTLRAEVDGGPGVTRTLRLRR